MKCPACQRNLGTLMAGGVVLDVCQDGCGGIWFDQHELRKIVRYGETAPEPLASIRRDPSVVVDTKARRMCPKCAPIIMQRRFYSVKGQIEIDECPKCGGIWLDAGELEAIQRLYESEEQQRQSEQKWVETASPTIERRSAPESVLPYLSRKIHYDPLGVTGYRSGDSQGTDIETWLSFVESSPDTRSPFVIWGAGLLAAAFLVLGGLRICITQHAAIGDPKSMYVRYPLQFRGLAAIGFGLIYVAIGLLLHFHLIWGTTPSLQRFSTPAKIASIILLIVGCFLFVWKAMYP